MCVKGSEHPHPNQLLLEYYEKLLYKHHWCHLKVLSIPDTFKEHLTRLFRMFLQLQIYPQITSM